MQITSQNPRAELHHRVAEIDNSAVAHGTNVDPVRGVGEEHLQAADAIEQDG